MFIACLLLAPGPKYQGPEDKNQCNPVKYLGYLKWMHLALFISVTIEHFTSENISTTALLCPKKQQQQQQTEDTKEVPARTEEQKKKLEEKKQFY